MKAKHSSRVVDLLNIFISGILLCAALNLLTGTSLAFGSSSDYVKLRENHPGVGAWFGMAVEDCTGTDPEKDCVGLGLPAVTIFMTPSFYADGNFLGNDSLALGKAPFGPHTTAHGEWVPTSRNGLVADIVFMLNPNESTTYTNAVHITYSATVITPTEMVGYVNINIFFPPLELNWQNLSAGEFPKLPPAADYLRFPQDRVYTDQNQCTTFPGCPLVFRFRVKRVAP